MGLPSVKAVLSMPHTSLQNEIHVTIPKPKPLVIPPEKPKKKKKDTRKRGDLYTPETRVNPNTKLASAINDTKAEAKAVNLLDGIGKTLKAEEERRKFLKEQLEKQN